LEWHRAPASGFTGSVSRRTEGSPWRTLAPVVPSADGALRFEDTAVTPGTRYAYRVTWSTGAVASTTAPAWADVPALHLGLARVANPVRDALTASFSLPDGSPARLALIDVTGRAVVTREVGSLGAGDHTVSLAARGALAPGRYWLRLVRG